jgi:peroxiredoxin
MRATAALALLAALSAPTLAPAAGDDFTALNLIRPARPTPAKDFDVPGPAGGRLRLRDFRGTVVLLNFWATWCPPCKEEMPSMERLYRRYRTRGFAVLAVSIDADGAQVVLPFVKQLGLTFPVGLDPKMALANEYRVRALPSTFLIDSAGQMVAIAIGPRDWDSRSARGVVESLLPGNTSGAAGVGQARPAPERSRPARPGRK